MRADAHCAMIVTNVLKVVGETTEAEDLVAARHAHRALQRLATGALTWHPARLSRNLCHTC